MITSATPAAPSSDEPTGSRLARRLPAGLGPWWYCLAAYLVTRIAFVVGCVIAADVRSKPLILAKRADAWWYLHIAQHGYGTTLHPLGVDPLHSHYSPWAFFPGFPLLVRGVHTVIPAPWGPLAVGISAVLGLLAVRAVYAAAAIYAGDGVARGAALLFAAWPGSAVLNLPYSEGLYVAATATALWALMARRWWVAGVLTAVATATRPTGLALVLAAVVAAGLGVRAERSIRPVVAPILGVLGIVGFIAFGWAQTGHPLIWRSAEQLWHQHIDFGYRMFHQWVVHPGVRPSRTALQALGVLFLIIALVAVIRLRRRINPVLGWYGLGAVAMIVSYSEVGPRPRMLLAVVPLFCWIARAYPPRAVKIGAALLVPALAATTVAYLTVNIP